MQNDKKIIAELAYIKDDVIIWQNSCEKYFLRSVDF